MKERPIIFSTEMVRAILDGRKTQTRRVMEPSRSAKAVQLEPDLISLVWVGEGWAVPMVCPYGNPGDRLWVRETWCYAHPDYHDESEGRRKGDRPVREYPAPWWCHYGATDYVDGSPWRSPRYMPRWASRITLEVVSVRAQRLRDISEDDARAEGVEPMGGGWRDYLHPGAAMITAPASFATLWYSINGKDPAKRWEANPYVWAVEFRRVKR